jgi:hypothetical protein
MFDVANPEPCFCQLSEVRIGGASYVRGVTNQGRVDNVVGELGSTSAATADRLDRLNLNPPIAAPGR